MAFDNIHNYDEQLVLQRLNDMVYYMTIKEREQMEYEIDKAVSAAVEYVTQHRNDRVNSV